MELLGKGLRSKLERIEAMDSRLSSAYNESILLHWLS